MNGNLIQHVTYAIKTHKRPKELARLVRSLNVHCAGHRVLVGDDAAPNTDKAHALYQKLAAECRSIDLDWILLPDDAGLAAGRNALVRECETEFVCVLDDDFVFTDRTDVGAMLSVLAFKPAVGVVCGAVADGNGVVGHYEGDMELVPNEAVVTSIAAGGWSDSPVRHKIVDIGYNFLMARRAVFDDIGWDERFKIGAEHGDFFLRLKYGTKWGVAYVPQAVVKHVRDGASAEYRKARGRSAEYLRMFFDAHGVKRYDVFGVRIEPDGAGIRRTKLH